MKKHLKRLATPKSWPLERKITKFVTRPRSSHKTELCLPLSVILRDILGYAKTASEAKKILNNEHVLVDGRRRKDTRLGIGLMDVLQIQKTKENYRVILDNKGKLVMIKENNPTMKPCKITGKRVLKNGVLQVNLHDGKNLLTDKKVKLGDTLVIELPGQKILEHLSLEKSCLVYLTGGKHIGETGQVEDIKSDTIRVKIGSEVFETAKKLAFVIGKQKPIISLEKS